MTPLHSFSFTLGLKFMSEKKKDIFHIFFSLQTMRHVTIRLKLMKSSLGTSMYY